MNHVGCPSAQLNALIRSVKAIYNEFKMVVLPTLAKAKKHRDVSIGADDLVPIFLFVFCQSRVRHPMRHKEMMWSLCHPDQLQGEAGYYLTVFESAIEFVAEESLESTSFGLRFDSSGRQSIGGNSGGNSGGGSGGNGEGRRSSLRPSIYNGLRESFMGAMYDSKDGNREPQQSSCAIS